MLSFCRAYVIASNQAQDRSLTRLAERAGFGLVGTAFGARPIAIETGPRDVAFFFVHHRLADTAMAAIIQLLRESDNDAVRFAPIILVTGDCTPATLVKYVHYGYDDILSLHEKLDTIVGRLQRQINCEHIYYETFDYLGPDRRRFEQPEFVDTRRGPDSAHTRLTIRRNVPGGIAIVRRQLVGRLIRPRPPAAVPLGRPG